MATKKSEEVKEATKETALVEDSAPAIEETHDHSSHDHSEEGASQENASNETPEEQPAQVTETAVQVEQVVNEVPAQKMGQPQEMPDTIEDTHMRVQLDRVILDPNSPEAVQVPDEGKGSLDLPIHRLHAESPEQAFASGNAKNADATREQDNA